MKSKLTKEEKNILASYEKGEWVPVANRAKRKKELIAYAKNTLRKDKRVNIRISERDLVELQRKAVKQAGRNNFAKTGRERGAQSRARPQEKPQQ
jgi:predicted DNA binding CopG/RHH family protein